MTNFPVTGAATLSTAHTKTPKANSRHIKTCSACGARDWDWIVYAGYTWARCARCGYEEETLTHTGTTGRICEAHDGKLTTYIDGGEDA